MCFKNFVVKFFSIFNLTPDFHEFSQMSKANFLLCFILKRVKTRFY